jgi:ribosomal protein S18 acetylase RimI-like enzyme
VVGENPHFSVETYGAEPALGLAGQIWPVYQEAFADFDDYDTWQADMFARHAERDGYRLVVGRGGPAVAGFAWGYTGQRGQYWSDLVVGALPRAVTDEWVGGHYEFVELAVTQACRRHGLGLRLHDALLDGVTGNCLLSTTDDPDDAAVRLYRSRGWRKLGLLRPGTQVMGLHV